MKESNLRKIFMPKWQAANGRLSKLFRNNTGGYKTESGMWISYGVGLWRRINRRKPYRPVGGGDLIGWTSKDVCFFINNIPESQKEEPFTCLIDFDCDKCPHNGKQIAIFTSIELKTKGVPETQDQKDWKKLVIESGGIAEVIKE